MGILDAPPPGELLYGFRANRAGGSGWAGGPAIHDIDFEEGGSQ